ncbi:hypothetical protein TARUN_5537 [Trichoderma arundinaceum]|uniref:Heterokaryon incompatibility domain-containing protein n=1 Tax=Trichoderma arundinaceum TaxID=490622 RepID=A0A395NLD4_TRIAR|nr:hypothetical protein TARUN_5537 [Trichoderma arundinaceum]
MAGIFTWRGTEVHEDFARTPTIAKPSHTKRPLRDKSFYSFLSVTESSLGDSQILCRHCSVLQLKDVLLTRSGTPNGKKPLELKADVPGFEDNLEYSRKDAVPLLPGLAESAETGCGFCALLRNAMIQHFQRYPLERLPDNAIEITKIRHYWNHGLTAFTVHSPAFVRPGHRFGYLTFRVSANLNGMVHSNDILVVRKDSFDMIGDIDTCASVFDIYTERIPDSVISPAGIFTLKRWVFGKGEEKAALKTLYRPTRLVHVESRKESGLIRLVESHSLADMDRKPQPYLALSYCWGTKAPSLTTTKSNYAQLKTSISYDTMPKAYQDTVRIARALGVKYIWIDALCIIQDDTRDWETESQMMAEIFRNSLVTIIPLRSMSSNDGFLERNPSLKINYHSSEWNISGSFFLRHIPFSYESAESSIRAAPTFSDRPVSLELHNSHWQTRGWTFQEDVFAMRRLYFGQLMMYWDSLKPADVMRTEDKIIDDKLDRIGTAELSIIHSSEPWRGDYDYDGWYYPILKYCKKKLTYETDRLPAVSSYAKLIASKSEDTYLAGLWKKNLHRGLLWKIHRRERRTFSEVLRKLTTPSKYIAPSWSWASRHGGLHLDLSDNMRPECDFLEAKTSVYGGDRFGRCEWLALEDDRYVAQCALDWRETEDRGRQLSEANGDSILALKMLLVSSGHTKTPSVFSRKPQEWEDKDEDPPLEVMHGLLLYPTGKASDEYWRVGLFHSLTDERGGRRYFDKCEQRTLRIV